MKAPRTARISIVEAIFALVVAAAIIIYLLWHTGYRMAPEAATEPPPRFLTAMEKAAFFEQRVAPVLDTNAAANREATATLKSAIHSQFEQYRQRVPSFTEDINGVGNKSKITWEAMLQMGSDDKDKVKRHVTGKFEMHVVSAEKMQQDLELIVLGFQRDLEANNNRMLADIAAAIDNDPRFSALGIAIPESFAKDLETKISGASQQAGKDAVVLSGMTLLVSFATEEAVRRLVAVALTRVGASLATSMGATAAASGGATVVGGAGGGTAGTLGGPVGTAIGLGAGLLVGVAVDWVMSDRMKSKLNEECTGFLTKAEQAVIESPEGLVPSEIKLAELNQVKAAAIHQQIQSLP